MSASPTRSTGCPARRKYKRRWPRRLRRASARTNRAGTKKNFQRMTTPNRSALLNKIYKVLKKHGKPQVVRGEQPVLESLLLGCCLENTHHAAGEQVYNTLKSSFF